MRKVALKSSLIGLSFAGLSYTSFMIFGYQRISVALIMYLYILLAVIISILSHRGLLQESFIDRFGDLMVLSVKDREVRSLVTGERYRLKGRLKEIN